MDWITDHIAIGNHFDAKSLPQEINAVLCLKPDCCENRDDIDAVCIPLIDGPGNDPQAICDAIAYVAETVDAGRRVLVHCHAGRSRSVVVVAHYLMSRQYMSQEHALQKIRANRDICLSDGIEELLLGRM